MTEVDDFRLPVTEPGAYPDRSRVRLRGEVTGVYDLARAGAEGWIREHRYDPNGGYRMVFVEWDPTHWTFNGQGNMWTFEDHFELVHEDKMSDNKNEIRAALKVLAGALGADDEGTPPQGNLKAVEDKSAQDEDYISILREAVNAARNGEGFILIALQSEQVRGREQLVPHVFKAERNDNADLLLGAYASHLGGVLHLEHVLEAIQGGGEDPDEGPDDLVG